mgnify:CR=1 FL=1
MSVGPGMTEPWSSPHVPTAGPPHPEQAGPVLWVVWGDNITPAEAAPETNRKGSAPSAPHRH